MWGHQFSRFLDSCTLLHCIAQEKIEALQSYLVVLWLNQPTSKFSISGGERAGKPLESPFACCSRVTSRDSPKGRAHSLAGMAKCQPVFTTSDDRLMQDHVYLLEPHPAFFASSFTSSVLISAHYFIEHARHAQTNVSSLSGTLHFTTSKWGPKGGR